MTGVDATIAVALSRHARGPSGRRNTATSSSAPLVRGRERLADGGLGREHGISVIDGGGPLMFAENGDVGHKLMCKVLTWTGKVPRTV